MSVEWMVALVVFAVVGGLWYSQRGHAPYRRRAARGGDSAGPVTAFSYGEVSRGSDDSNDAGDGGGD